MRKIIICNLLAFLLLLLSSGLYAQQDPTWTDPPSNGNQNGTDSEKYWSRAGNTDHKGKNNFFGTLWNSPIYTYTNRERRMKLNGTFGPSGTTMQYSLNGYGYPAVNTSGYLLLGADGNINSHSIYKEFGAFSLLHLNGNQNNSIQELGYRPWMKTGVTFTDHTDLAYIGLRRVPNGGFLANSTELAICWSNDSGPVFGPDDMVFRFLSGGGNAPNGNSISPNDNVSDDLDGLHIARFTGTGDLGLGPEFDHIYRPTHRLHVQGNGRFEQIPDKTAANYLVLGQSPANPKGPDDLELRKMAFSGNVNEVLLGDGTWGNVNIASGNNVTANNGLSYTNSSAGTNVQLGGDLIKNTFINLQNYNISHNGTGAILIGHSPVAPQAKLDIRSEGTRKPFRITYRNNPGTSEVAYLDMHTNGRTQTRSFGSFGWEHLLESSGNSEGGSFYNTVTTNSVTFAKSLRSAVIGNFSGQAFAYQAILNNNHSGASNTGFYANINNRLAANCGVRINLQENENHNEGVNTFVQASGTGGINTGVVGRINSPGANTTNFGVSGIIGDNSGNGYATSSTNYAVYGNASGQMNGSNSWAGYFAGNTYSPGAVWTASDRKLKTGIKDFENAKEILGKLKPHRYAYLTDDYPGMGLPEGDQIGFLAQDLRKILPELTTEVTNPEIKDENGEIISEKVDFIAMNYQALIPILVKGHQEQQEELEQQEKQIQQLGLRVQELESAISTLIERDKTGVGRINESNSAEENEINSLRVFPNPFSDFSEIAYQVREGYSEASLEVVNSKGEFIRRISLSGGPTGVISFCGTGLSKGIYTLYLKADGKIVAAQSFVKL